MDIDIYNLNKKELEDAIKKIVSSYPGVEKEEVFDHVLGLIRTRMNATCFIHKSASEEAQEKYKYLEKNKSRILSANGQKRKGTEGP